MTDSAAYELKVDAYGIAKLTLNGALVWSSDNEDSDDYSKLFGDVIEDDEVDDLIDWLCVQDHIPEGADVDSVCEYVTDDDESNEDEDADEDEDEDDLDEDDSDDSNEE